MAADNARTEDVVQELISPARLRPYLRAAEGDLSRALAIYSWSTRMSSATFELISHLEVALRNTLDRQLRNHVNEESRGIPWLFCEPVVNNAMSSTISTTRARLRGRDRDSRDQIIANLSFGFWSGMLGTSHEELWRKSLHNGFPYSDGRRTTEDCRHSTGSRAQTSESCRTP